MSRTSNKHFSDVLWWKHPIDLPIYRGGYRPGQII